MQVTDCITPKGTCIPSCMQHSQSMTVNKIGLQTQSITGSHTGALKQPTLSGCWLFTFVDIIARSHMLLTHYSRFRFRANLQGLPDIEPFLKASNTTRRDYRSSF